MSSPAPIFGSASLQKYVNRELGTIPEGKRGVILAVNAGNGWIEVLVYTKLGEGWDLTGRLGHERANGTTVGVEIRRTW